MLKDTSVRVLLAVVLCAGPAWGQGEAPSASFPEPTSMRAKAPAQTLSSASAADRLWQIGYEIANTPNISGPQADQAILLLTAAKSLNAGITPVEPLLLKLATRRADRDYSGQMVGWLRDYVTESADRTVVRNAIQYLLDRLNSREDRKGLLEQLVNVIGNKNPAIDSDLAMLLGFLLGERGDLEAAKFYLIQAYQNNRYNKISFMKLTELAPDEIGVTVYLEHLRLVLRENPLDLNAALNFAQYAERLQLYDIASLSYQYCAELFRYLYPSEPLPAQIYLPWAISSYNTVRGQPVARQIAESVRNAGRFDMLLDAIAGRAAAKSGNPQEADRIFRQAEQRALQALQSSPPQTQGAAGARIVTPRQFAWFYCFADPNPKKAVEWANRAYATEPNAPSTPALLAYALASDNQVEWARPLLQPSDNSQIADLVRAKIQLSEGDKRQAIQTLKVAIAKDAGSLAAERAKEMLHEMGDDYICPVDTQALTGYLTESLGKAVIPQFLAPDRLIQPQFTIRGSEFAYGSEIEGTVSITNQGSEPLVVTGESLFRGGIRIDAKVSGDLQKEIPALVSQTVHTELTVAPQKSLVIPVRLSSGALRQLLQGYPQASFEIEFTLYLDPVVVGTGAVSNRLVDIKPVTVSVKRPRLDLSASYVRSRFNSISSGQQGQKIVTGQLFTGLLQEQRVMAEQGTLYPYRYADWMPGLLKSALTSDSGLLLGRGEDDWVVAVNAMADMLSMPMDDDLAGAVAKDLHHSKWPVRMMALYLLASRTDGGFEKVLSWFSENDTSDLVRGMAATLRSAGPAALGSAGPDALMEIKPGPTR